MSHVPGFKLEAGETGTWDMEHGTGVGRVSGGSNQFGVGARVTVWTEGRRQVREVRCGSGYQSQNDLRAHVGLGAFERIDSLEVRWPGGLRQVLRDLAADRVLTVVEGDGGAF